MPEPAVIVYDPYTAESIINKKVHTLRYGERKNGMYGYYERHYRGQTLYEKTERKLRKECEDAGASHLYYRGNHNNEDGSTSDTRCQTYERQEKIRYKLRIYKKSNNNNNNKEQVKDFASNTRSINKNKQSPTIVHEPPPKIPKRTSPRRINDNAQTETKSRPVLRRRITPLVAETTSRRTYTTTACSKCSNSNIT